ncbi:unnamed protein product [Callosobruchus maculatus]|uniref:BED-type domain-containing protein n=1 Tax=Callosobruchus maculatus TaxID=64391 RepID=A0A653CMP6_CALMS|nr:unnamed protein product [Callosobruchus maculatus]VEN53779.1 unnamed protein product [Callosobruchus maculatus]
MAPKKSIIWNFFTEKPKSEKIAVYGICKQELNFKSTSNNLRKHMTRSTLLLILTLMNPQTFNRKIAPSPLIVHHVFLIISLRVPYNPKFLEHSRLRHK